MSPRADESTRVLTHAATGPTSRWRTAVAMALCVSLASPGAATPAPRPPMKTSTPSVERPVAAGCDDAGRQTSPLSGEERKQLAEKADRYFRLLAEADKATSHADFDPQAVVNEVGKDPERLAQWVRDNTVLVPYEGVLRGAVGVLMDRVGNSLDRALLLHSLLRAAGRTARLTRGRLADHQLAVVVAQLQPLRRRGAAPSAPRSSREAADIVREYVRQRGSDPAELAAAAARVYEEHTGALRTFSTQVAEQTTAVLAKVSALRPNDARPPLGLVGILPPMTVWSSQSSLSAPPGGANPSISRYWR